MRIKNGGTTAKEGYISAAKSGGTALLKNCFAENGKIVSRPGLCTVSGEIFTKSDLSVEEMTFINTDCYLYSGGKYGRIAVSVADNLTGNIIYNIRLVCADGSVQDMSSITFGRVTYDQFGVPDSFTVFRGRPTRGSGIYFVARVVYGENYSDRIVVRELSADQKVWIYLDESYLYVPTVLANGRGDAYYTAAPLGEALQLKKTVTPESRNLINPAFRCCFTADSSSWSFRLPYNQLDNGLISCDFMLDGETYSWRIYANETRSQETAVKGTGVTMRCDRAAGRIFFQNSQDVGWAPTYTGELNNVRITARKTFFEDMIKVSSMTACRQIDAAVTNGEYDLTVFYKSREYPALLLMNTPDEPLYFPEGGRITLGESETAVTCLIPKGKNLLAFKENEIYSAQLSRYEVNSTAIVSGDSATVRKLYSPEFIRLAESDKSVNPQSITVIGSRLYFATLTGEIYSAEGDTAYTFKTEKVCDCDSTVTGGGFGLRWGEKYLLIRGSRICAVQKQDSGYCVADWSFPTEFVGGIYYLDCTLLFARYQGEGLYRLYPACLEGEKDIYLTENGWWTKDTEKDIEAECSMELFESAPLPKRLYRMRVDCSAKEITATLFDRERPLAKKRLRPKGGRAELICGCTAYSPRLALNFSGAFALEGVAVKYGLLTKI